MHRHAVENLDQADALLFGRVTYEMMEAAWRRPARTGARPEWMELMDGSSFTGDCARARDDLNVVLREVFRPA